MNGKFVFASFVAVLAVAGLGVEYASVANAKVLKPPIVNQGGLKLAPPLSPAAPHYRFSVDSFNILDTRSRHQDTDYVTVGLTGQPNQVKAMGDVNNGIHQVGVFFDAAVPANGQTSLSYAIANTGEDSVAAVEFFQTLTFSLGGAFGQDWSGLLSGGCDGLVAKGQHSFTAAQLAAQTAGGKVITGNDYTPGTDSPTGCGSNSRYYVKWSVAAVQ